MTIYRRSRSYVKVKVVGQANAVGSTSIEGSFFLLLRAAMDVRRCFGQRYEASTVIVATLVLISMSVYAAAKQPGLCT